MKRRAIAIRCSVLAALVCLLASGGARAQSCVNDVDCPDSACGGQVFCTFTKPSDAPGAGNGGHGGGSGGSAGASGAGGAQGTGGSAQGTGGSAQGTGGAGAAGQAGSGDGGSSGGCSIAGASTPGEAPGCVLLASLGLAAVFRRRRTAP